MPIPSSGSNGAPDGPHMRRCSRCGKRFTSRRATDQHIASVHKGQGHRMDARRPDDEDDFSLAALAVDAEIKHASGEELSELEKALLGL